jgi:hypothetical protein
MKLKFKGGHMTIDDNSEEAKKIRLGHDYEVSEQGLEIKEIPQEATNKYQLINEVEKANSLQDVKSILIKALNLI